MRLRDAILWQVYIDDATSLQHQLPYHAISDSLVDVANVDGGFLVLLPALISHERCRSPEGGITNQCLAPDILRLLKFGERWQGPSSVETPSRRVVVELDLKTRLNFVVKLEMGELGGRCREHVSTSSLPPTSKCSAGPVVDVVQSSLA